MTDRLPTHFDRGKSFYPVVMHFLTMLYGFKELAARGVALQLHELKGEPDAASGAGAS